MASRIYPLWKPGAPQLRIFMPNFSMVLLKPKPNSPPNLVTFRVDLAMTATDVKNYLRKIYDVPAVQVRTEVFRPEEETHPSGMHKWRPPDYKLAFVLLDKDHKFEFPNILPEERQVEVKKQDQEYTDLIDRMRQKNLKDWDRSGAPTWFSV